MPIMVSADWLDRTRIMVALALRNGDEIASGHVLQLLGSAMLYEQDPQQCEKIGRAIERVHGTETVNADTVKIYFNVFVARYGAQVGYTTEIH
jgi:hypothetical protein